MYLFFIVQDLHNEWLPFMRVNEYNDRSQFPVFVCDKASASGGLNKFHNTLHFDPGE